MPQLSDALKPGRHVELGVGDASLGWFATRVEDYNGSDQLTLAWPTDADRRLVRLAAGQTVQVSVSARADALYATNATVQRADAGSVALVTLTIKGDWQRSQRRRAVRV